MRNAGYSVPYQQDMKKEKGVSYCKTGNIIKIL